MREILGLISFIIIAIGSIHAQKENLNFSIGPQYAVLTFPGIKSPAIGAGISLEHFLNRKTAETIDISYNYFKGNIINSFQHDTISGFSIMPVLAVCKYFLSDHVYISGGAGLVIGLHNAGNHAALSPGIALLVPVSLRSKIDIGVKLTGVPSGFSFSENTFLNKGGYSFLAFRGAYAF